MYALIGTDNVDDKDSEHKGTVDKTSEHSVGSALGEVYHGEGEEDEEEGDDLCSH